MIITRNQSLKEYNSFGIAVSASEFIECESRNELVSLVDDGLFKRSPVMILGGGSNILFTSNPEGVILHPVMNEIRVLGEMNGKIRVRAEAGLEWDRLVEYAVNNNLGGIENLSAIPGSTGAAPIQNIGAYGMEIKDCLLMVHAIDTDTGKDICFDNKECEFGYRESIFKNSLKGKIIITAIDLLLEQDPKEFQLGYGDLESRLENAGEVSLKSVRKIVSEIRAEKLPDPAVTGNAGSFFKNPVIRTDLFRKIEKQFGPLNSYPAGDGMVKVPAAWLIEKCGFKGHRKGDAGVHYKQPLVLVNHGNASGTDIFLLSEEIIHSVNERFGIVLDREVNII